MDAQLLSDEQLPSRRDKQPRGMAAAFAVLTAKAFLSCLALLLLYVLARRVFETLDNRPPKFSVTIDAFSGVDDHAPRAFNLTVGIDNLRGLQFEACVGGEAVVLYGGVPLAVGEVEELCVPGGRAANVAVVAASGGVGVPEALAEAMAREKKRAGGAVHVEVRVVMPKHTRLLSCTAPLDDDDVPSRPCPCRVAHLPDESDGVRPQGSGTPGFMV